MSEKRLTLLLVAGGIAFVALATVLSLVLFWNPAELAV
jgi:hypothetical protein